MDFQSQINPLIAGHARIEAMLIAQNVAAKEAEEKSDKKFEFFYNQMVVMKKDHQDLKDDVSKYKIVGGTLWSLLLAAAGYVGIFKKH